MHVTASSVLPDASRGRQRGCPGFRKLHENDLITGIPTDGGYPAERRPGPHRHHRTDPRPGPRDDRGRRHVRRRRDPRLLTDRAAGVGIPVDQLTGPRLATNTGGRLDQSAIWKIVRRLARNAEIPFWAELSPHSMRHTAITLALDAGTSLRDVQDYAGHRDARTTRRYDHSRGNLDRHASYAVAAWLA